MDIYITHIKSGSRVALSMLPETVKVKISGKFQTYDVMQVGEIKIPKGEKLATVSWSGTLPGICRRSASYIKAQHWQPPNMIISILSGWKKNGDKLRLMITGTSINLDVYIDSFTPQPTGGNGDYKYSMSFAEAKDIMIYTVNELGIKPASPTDVNRYHWRANAITNARPAPKTETTYTVKSGDTLWRIAKKYLGDGSRWPQLYEANRSVVGSNPNLIYPGQVLTIP